MKVGIISDSHDNLALIEKAIQQLNKENVDLVLHAGDYSAPFVVFKFNLLKAKMIGVFGNNDAEKELLHKNFETIGKQVRGKFVEVKLDDIKIALLHGEENDLLESLINTCAYDVVVYGHTHRAEIRTQNKTLIVNPGELCGYLTGKSTIGFLDTKTLKAELIYI
ncbi:MAG: metallophosphoesterase [Candidatus Jordarchaeaceae archaeon]